MSPTLPTTRPTRTNGSYQHPQQQQYMPAALPLRPTSERSQIFSSSLQLSQDYLPTGAVCVLPPTVRAVGSSGATTTTVYPRGGNPRPPRDTLLHMEPTPSNSGEKKKRKDLESNEEPEEEEGEEEEVEERGEGGIVLQRMWKENAEEHEEKEQDSGRGGGVASPPPPFSALSTRATSLALPHPPNLEGPPGKGEGALKITLQDCLACNGCITSAESILVASQSVQEWISSLRDCCCRRWRGRCRPKEAEVDFHRASPPRPAPVHTLPFLWFVTISHSSATSFAVYWNVSVTEAYEKIAGFLSFQICFHVKRIMASLARREEEKKRRAREGGKPSLSEEEMQEEEEEMKVTGETEDDEALLQSKYNMYIQITDLQWAEMFSVEKVCEEYIDRLKKAKKVSHFLSTPQAAACLPNEEKRDASFQVVPHHHSTSSTSSVSPRLPLIVSSCPGWCCYCEKQGEGIISLLSRVMSAQGIAGSFVKRLWYSLIRLLLAHKGRKRSRWRTRGTGAAAVEEWKEHEEREGGGDSPNGASSHDAPPHPQNSSSSTRGAHLTRTHTNHNNHDNGNPLVDPVIHRGHGSGEEVEDRREREDEETHSGGGGGEAAMRTGTANVSSFSVPPLSSLVYHLSIQPCFDKKLEASRDGLRFPLSSLEYKQQQQQQCANEMEKERPPPSSSSGSSFSPLRVTTYCTDSVLSTVELLEWMERVAHGEGEGLAELEEEESSPLENNNTNYPSAHANDGARVLCTPPRDWRRRELDHECCWVERIEEFGYEEDKEGWNLHHHKIRRQKERKEFREEMMPEEKNTKEESWMSQRNPPPPPPSSSEKLSAVGGGTNGASTGSSPQKHQQQAQPQEQNDKHWTLDAVRLWGSGGYHQHLLYYLWRHGLLEGRESSSFSSSASSPSRSTPPAVTRQLSPPSPSTLLDWMRRCEPARHAPAATTHDELCALPPSSSLTTTPASCPSSSSPTITTTFPVVLYKPQRNRNHQVISVQWPSTTTTTATTLQVAYGFQNIQNVIRQLRRRGTTARTGAMRTDRSLTAAAGGGGALGRGKGGATTSSLSLRERLAQLRQGQGRGRGSGAGGDDSLSPSSSSSRDELCDCTFLEIMACPDGCWNGGGQLREPPSDLLSNHSSAIPPSQSMSMPPILHEEKNDHHHQYHDPMDSSPLPPPTASSPLRLFSPPPPPTIVSAVPPAAEEVRKPLLPTLLDRVLQKADESLREVEKEKISATSLSPLLAHQREEEGEEREKKYMCSFSFTYSLEALREWAAEGVQKWGEEEGKCLWECIFKDRRSEFDELLNNGGVHTLQW